MIIALQSNGTGKRALLHCMSETNGKYHIVTRYIGTTVMGVHRVLPNKMSNAFVSLTSLTSKPNRLDEKYLTNLTVNFAHFKYESIKMSVVSMHYGDMKTRRIFFLYECKWPEKMLMSMKNFTKISILTRYVTLQIYC